MWAHMDNSCVNCKVVKPNSSCIELQRHIKNKFIFMFSQVEGVVKTQVERILSL